MTKRWIALFCALMMLLSLAACDDHGGDVDPTEASGADAASGAEEAFDKAFEADKAYDVDAMADVEYTVNFSKTLDKEACVKKAKDGVAQIDEDSLAAYIDEVRDARYTIIEKKPLDQEALKARIEELEPDYRDTDKITAIIVLTYTVTFPDDDGDTDSDESEVEMICVDGKWYCFMGETNWDS